MDDSSVGGGKLECREKDDQHLSFFKQGFNVLNLTISESYGENWPAVTGETNSAGNLVTEDG